jgi:copper resistance protein C
LAARRSGSSPMSAVRISEAKYDFVFSRPGENVMRRNRITAAALAAIAVLATAPAAFAHTHVHKTSIADNSRLAASPASFTVEFEGKTGLARAALTDASGKAIPLAYTPPTGMAASFTIPLPALPAGKYTLSWRTIGSDGHAVLGVVHFTVAGG